MAYVSIYGVPPYLVGRTADETAGRARPTPDITRPEMGMASLCPDQGLPVVGTNPLAPVRRANKSAHASLAGGSLFQGGFFLLLVSNELCLMLVKLALANGGFLGRLLPKPVRFITSFASPASMVCFSLLSLSSFFLSPLRFTSLTSLELLHLPLTSSFSSTSPPPPPDLVCSPSPIFTTTISFISPS